MSIHKGETGIALRFRFNDEATGAAIDPSDATSKTVKLRSPAGTILTKTGSDVTFVTIDAAVHVQYVIVANDLNEVGMTYAQATAVRPSGVLKSDHMEIDVKKNVEDITL